MSTVLPNVSAIDVVFLDLEMPGLDGFEVRDLLSKSFPETPIVAYTVHISKMNEIQQHGFSGMLGKPINSTRFPDQLARILRGEQVWERA